jgi:hypothetical protein
VSGRWTARRDRELIALWSSTDMSQAQIAKSLNFSGAYVSLRAAQLGLPPRGTPMAERAYLVAEAARRGITVERLREQLLRAIARDHMVTAVLDDLEVGQS